MRSRFEQSRWFIQRMNRRRALQTFGAVGAGAITITIVGCGGDDEDEPTTTTSGGTTTGGGAAASPTAAGGGGATTASPTTGGTPAPSGGGGPATGNLVISQDQEANTLDPALTYDLTTEPLLHNVYDTLLFRTPELKLEPGVAESYQALDDTTWEFKLRQNVKFQNGDPLTGEDVKFTLERVKNPDTKAPHRSLYQTIDRVDVVDPYTIRVVTTEPDPVIPTKLSGYGGNIIPKNYFEQVGAEAFGLKPIGSGPFKVDEWVKDDRMRLSAYEGHWRGAPKLKTVTHRPIKDENTRMAELLTGGVDIVKKVNPAQVTQISNSDRAKVVEAPSLNIVSLRFNTTKPPVDNVKVRQAMLYAIDVPGIIENLLNGYGRQIAIQLTEFHFGYDPKLQPYAYDPNRAKQLLQEAGVGSGALKVQLDFPSNDQAIRDVCQAVAAQWSEVGIEAEVLPQEVATYTDRMYKGELGEVWETGWGGWTADADNTFWSLYATPGQSNYRFGTVFYSNPELDRILEEARYEIDRDAREQLYWQADKIIYDEVPQVPLYQQVFLWGVNNRVQGFIPPPDDRFWLFPIIA